MPYPKIPAPERFARRVARGASDECWPWIGHLDRDGYGYFTLSKAPRKVAKAHRYAFFLAYGRWPDICRHRCDNPACCNPAHLQDGTHADNVTDMWRRGRQQAYRHGADHHATRFSMELARAIRRRHAAGESKAAISRSTGVSHTHVGHIIRGHYWAEEE